MSVVIEVEDLHKRYDDRPVLRGVDLRIERGHVVALLGPNGAGKTTFVRILATLLPFERGRVRVGGHDVARAPAAVRGSIGLTGQYASVDEVLTGAENLELFGRLLHLGRRRARVRTVKLLEQFDLGVAADRRVATYSGGMRRRLDLAASLLGDPPVVILDEPTSGLDPRSRRTLWTVVRDLTTDGVTVLLTTQYLEEADALADRVAVLHHGRIVTEGTARDLKAQVGADRLTLSFDDPAALAAAGALLGDGAVSDETALTTTLAVRSPDDLRRALDTLAARAIAVAGVSLDAPTLDDVFLAVTADRGPQAAR